MMYAASRNSVLQFTAKEAGVVVDGKLEAGGLEDVGEEAVLEALGLMGGVEGVVGGGAGAGAGGGEGRGFSRPKRPGRR